MSVWSDIGPLVGVVIGGGISWGTQWRLAARTDRLDARAAKRQVRAELRRYEAFTASAADDPRLIEFATIELDDLGSKAWDRHSDRLARQMTDADWATVQAAYESVANLVWQWKGNKSVREEDASPTHKRIEDAIRRLD
ncbi:MAG TPA: hypothetical protein VMD09_15945 [Solirubrobacteraceae bacterium]|nr:hypothetical protein [Solirubrobacteraceae bacterium]